jgi:hypothetical protein
MPWVEKQHQTAFEQAALPLYGLFLLDGDLLAAAHGREWTKGQKYPLLVFPSGKACELWESSSPDSEAIVHLFGELDLPLRSTRDEAFAQANAIAEQVGYFVQKRRDNELEIGGHDSREHFLLIYDNTQRRLEDVKRLLGQWELPRPPLLDDASRQRLPKLYSGEKLGLKALAQVKFFTPDAHWTWYASEFDGKDLFFGLVIGDFIELGSFSLSELATVRGGLGLPVERDKFFEPTPLGELKAHHERERRRPQ